MAASADAVRATTDPVVVTGGAGFIGSHVVTRLAGRCPVWVVDDFSTGEPARLPDEVRVIEADVRNEDRMRQLLSDARAVIHEAAIADVSRSVTAPKATHAVTFDGTLAVLEAARETDTRVVAASSAAVYGDPEAVPIHESARTRPTSPYGIDKLAADAYVRAYHRLYGLDTVALRYFNVYGPPPADADSRTVAEGDSADAVGAASSGVVSTFVGQARAGEPITVHGDGSQTRDFVHVSDVARATIAALETDACGEAFNVGRGEALSIRELAETVRRVTSADVPIVHESSRTGDITDSVAAIEKARRHLDYEPSVSLAEGIRTLL